MPAIFCVKLRAMNSLEGLNPRQREAAEHAAGPLLIVAGAGAGKTKTLVARVGRLIEKGVAPEKILAITFTNKAAGEMRERVEQLLKPCLAGRQAKTYNLEPNISPFVSTFHALGAHLLREQAAAAGLENRRFAILDRDESLAAIKESLKEAGFDPKQLEPRRVLGRISREKGNGVNLAGFQTAVGDFFADIVAQVWARYDRKLRERQALDFDDLLLRTVELLASAPAILAQYQTRWSHLHIDEYQDTNAIQYRLAQLLAAGRRNLCVVGDVDQSIYSWRGADFRNLLRFEEDYPDATVVLLEQNYRSTKTILAAANEIIKKNVERREKNLFTENAEGEPIQLWSGLDEKEEAALVVEECARLIGAGFSASEIAVLYRANFQSRALEEAFLRAGLPYQVLGTRFFERREVKDVLAYLKAALNPNDIESVRRIINLPPRGVGKVTLAKFYTEGLGALPLKMREKIGAFQKLLADIRELAERERPSETLKFIIRRSGLEKMLREEGTEEAAERLANVQELVTFATRYDTLGGDEAVEKLLTDAALASEQDSLGASNQRPATRLMTVHAAKGLEFRVVFVTGLEQDLFPHRGFGEAEESAAAGEEERRLFYVALTRAKEKLYLTYAESRTIYGSRRLTLPSEFLADIPPALLATREFLLSVDF